MKRLVVGAAAGIAAITVLSRIVGFGRTAVLSRTLGPSCVGDTYAVANAIPNVVFEVVAGGALASLVVPLLAGLVAQDDRAAASRTASALLTWTVLLLTPIALLGLLVAPHLLRALAGSDPTCGPAMLTVGTRMLLVFLPQVVLYGVGVVLAGILQAHRRFLGPALAPLLSSLVVITAYLLYAGQGRSSLADLSRRQELTLSVGTTLGVAVLSLGLLVPLRRCGLTLRPTLGFAPGVARQARRLAVAGIAALAAQQVALVVALRLAATGDPGSVVLFQVATALFLLPWAVLAVPVATSAFPEMSVRAAAGEDDAFGAVTSRALTAVLVACFGAAVVLAAVSLPVARLLIAGAPGPQGVIALAHGTAVFAPGLVGYGILALVSRALYARGDGRTPALATVTGWLVVVVADVVVVVSEPGMDRVVALAIGNTIGMSVMGALLLLGLARASRGAVSGLSRSVLSGLAGSAAAGTVALLLPSFASSLPASALACVVVGGVTAGVYLAVVRLVHPEALRTLIRA